MCALWNRLWTTRRDSAGRARCQKRALEVTSLERRDLMAIIPGSSTIPPISAIATPQILPNNNRLIAVQIHGEFHQGLTSILGKGVTTEPPPSSMFYIQRALNQRAMISPVNVEVTDQYRQYQPRVKAHVQLVKSAYYFNPPNKATPASEVLLRDYTYTAVVYLEASKNSSTNGRRYTVSVSVSDSDNGAGVNFAVVVPDKSSGHAKTTVTTTAS